LTVPEERGSADGPVTLPSAEGGTADPQSGYYLVAKDGGIIDFGAAWYDGHTRGAGAAT